jgi:hypothetical protein
MSSSSIASVSSSQPTSILDLNANGNGTPLSEEDAGPTVWQPSLPEAVSQEDPPVPHRIWLLVNKCFTKQAVERLDPKFCHCYFSVVCNHWLLFWFCCHFGLRLDLITLIAWPIRFHERDLIRGF